MIIWLSPADARHHHWVVHRPPLPALRTTLETRSLLLHDLVHYAVEAALETEEGFYGLLAAGADPATLREASLDEPQWAALMRIEQRVVLLQSAFKHGSGPLEGPAAEGLRRLWGAWSKVRPPEGLRLRWPPRAPEVGPPPRTPIARSSTR